ncbi:MAG: putative DNA binding domain-containing protein [Myxococcales bacterium]|nr:putative DNA binding domain-containing protein [Myxococcales bacterium]
MNYTDAELARMAVDLESDLVERKESLAEKDRAAQAICAFSNDLPAHRRSGVLFIGLTDEGAPTGLAVDDALLTTLSAIRSDGNVLPLPVMSVAKRSVAGGDVAVVTVRPHDDPPVRFKGQVWVRVGPRRALASREEERILVERRQSVDLPFDKRPLRGATLADLDLDTFRREYLPSAVAPDTLAENDRTVEHQLAALHLLARDGSPNAAAVLLFGRDPRYWLPGAYVQFVRYQGTSVTDPIVDQKVIDGPLPQMLRRADEVATSNIRVPASVEGRVTDARTPDYPADALRQLLANAVMHRNYETSNAPVAWFWFDDRIEIHNPGGLFGRVTEENFGTPGATDYRNPTIAEALKVLGFVQRFGMGVALARKHCAANGNPLPQFVFAPAGIAAIVRSRP